MDATKPTVSPTSHNWDEPRRPSSASRWLRRATGAWVLVVVLWAEGAAQPRPGAEDEALRVSFVADAACGSPDDQADFLDALRARLPELVVEPPPASSGVNATLRWEPIASGGCWLALTTPWGTESLPLGPGAGDADLRAAAVRVAWWLETPWEQPPTAPGEAEPEWGPPAEALGRLRPLEVPAEPDQPTVGSWASASFLISTEFGAAWYPTPGAATGVVRILALLPVYDGVQLGLETRLGTELAVPFGRPELDVLERSVGAFARYQDGLGSRWLVDASLGLRFAFPQLEVEGATLAEFDSEVSNLFVVSGVGGGFQVTRILRLKLDVLGAVALATRRIEGSDGSEASLGVFTLDALLGVELAF